MKRAWVITRKEWAEVFKNRFVLFTVAFLPLLMTAIPLGTFYFGGRSGVLTGLSAADIPSSFQRMCAEVQGEACALYFLISQFMLLFMLIPLAIPVTIASYSIVGEKSTRTLEPVLATPISTLQLLTGKALAGVIPAVVATWAAFGLFIVGVILLGMGEVLSARVLDPVWLMAVFLAGPLMSLAAVNVAMMISSRATDPRVAEQLSMLVILPLLGLLFGQMAGLIYINEQLILWMVVALIPIDAGLLAFAVQVFRRETILTRWK